MHFFQNKSEDATEQFQEIQYAYKYLQEGQKLVHSCALISKACMHKPPYTPTQPKKCPSKLTYTLFEGQI